MEKKKIGFFKKIILAITDFRFYPYVLKNESASRSFGHFILFLMLLVLIISIKTTSMIYDGFDMFIEQYDALVPEFKIEKGILAVDYVGTKEIRNDMVTVVDTACKYEECIKTSRYEDALKYDNILLINSDAISLIDGYGETVQAPLSFVEGAYDKETFKEYIVALFSSLEVKAMLVGMIFFAMFMAFMLYKFVEVLFFGILALLISGLAGIRINFKAQMKIVLYAMTLPYIVETISIIYVGGIKEYTMLASGILAYVYIFYAIRAIKLDMLLMIMANDKKGSFKLKIDPDGKYEVQKVGTEEQETDENQMEENEKENYEAKKTEKEPQKTKENNTLEENSQSKNESEEKDDNDSE